MKPPLTVLLLSLHFRARRELIFLPSRSTHHGSSFSSLLLLLILLRYFLNVEPLHPQGRGHRDADDGYEEDHHVGDGDGECLAQALQDDGRAGQGLQIERAVADDCVGGYIQGVFRNLGSETFDQETIAYGNTDGASELAEETGDAVGDEDVVVGFHDRLDRNVRHVDAQAQTESGQSKVCCPLCG